MKSQAFLIIVATAMVFGLVRIGWSQDAGAVSIDEVKAQKSLDSKHSNIIDGLKKKYPDVDFSDVKRLKNHPDVAKRLLHNKRWLNKHPEVARKLYKDKEFLRKHPDIAKRIRNGNITADKREDVRDRVEDIRDRREDRIDRWEDVRDRREDVRDRREDVRDRRDDVTRPDRLRKSDREIRHHKSVIRDNKRDIRKKRRTTGPKTGQRGVRGNVPKGVRAKSSNRKHRR